MMQGCNWPQGFSVGSVEKNRPHLQHENLDLRISGNPPRITSSWAGSGGDEVAGSPLGGPQSAAGLGSSNSEMDADESQINIGICTGKVQSAGAGSEQRGRSPLLDSVELAPAASKWGVQEQHYYACRLGANSAFCFLAPQVLFMARGLVRAALLEPRPGTGAGSGRLERRPCRPNRQSGNFSKEFTPRHGGPRVQSWEKSTG
jgi:hypothetical protein